MLISLNWLRDYVEVPVPAPRLAEDLTMLGLNVEGLTHRPNPFAALRIGRVLSALRHPNADKLTVCTVDIGEGRPRQIVCGAPNVRAGLEVPVVPAGVCLPDGTLIKEGKLRGERSEGMICSAIELGLGADASGIMELAFGAAPGTPLSAHFGEEDWLLEIEVTPNRPDQLGVYGIAREVAALYRAPLRAPDTALPPGSAAALPPVAVEIRDPEGCPRYIARRLRGVTVGPSPAWLQARLATVGLRAINNVVDVTNYVLYETGHPLHAFDAARLAEGRIVVRRAAAGERLVTLDEQELTLTPEDLVIADAAAPVALAGIMGGEASKVAETTRELVLESAVFAPGRIRGSRRRHGLSSESSYRFERGAAGSMAALASARATALLVACAGAQAAQASDDVVAAPAVPRRLRLRPARVNALMGTALGPDAIAELLGRLELTAAPAGEELLVAVPDFRVDIGEEIDLIEEVARLYGYGAVPLENRMRNSLHGALSPAERAEAALQELLVGQGCQEVLTSSFMDEQHLDAMGLAAEDPRRRAVRLRNPLVSFNSVLRSSLVPGLLDVLITNFHRGQEELRVYELGRVYRARAGEALPEEPRQLALLLTGHSAPAHWSQPAAPVSLADLRGIVEAIAARTQRPLTISYEGADPYLVSGASFRVLEGERCVGQGGLLRPALLAELKQKREVFLLEFFVPYGAPSAPAHHTPLPSFPASRRDIALLVPEGLRWQAIAGCISGAGGEG
ncbi:phenylalanine--tRNA ligase subunit beta, partial [bacterium]|nr:phenylalanine--tRNA ligase subunit beta [bacterium]